MNTLYCATCHRPFTEGEFAWASDWKVLSDDGWGNETWCNETRYTCDECEANE
jgi:hypothetical protein